MSGFVKEHPALSQFALAFGIGTAILIPVNAGILPQGLFMLAAFSASLAGIALTALVSGKEGLRDLFSKLRIWRVGTGWWTFAVFSVLGVVILAMAANALFGLGSFEPGRIISGMGSFVPFFVMLMITGGLGEELGWRGFMLPRIQARHNALVASLIVGILHGLWHVPMFFIEGLSPYQEMAAAANVIVVILGYTLFYITPWAILYTCLLNNTRGSLLLVAAMHAGEAWVLSSWDISNTSGFIGLGIGMTLTAIIVLLIFGPKHLSRTNEKFMIDEREEVGS
ncbi:type II CAAX prenyl endopeptidase Rce1 family protein [Gemmatimonadota bacterium]